MSKRDFATGAAFIDFFGGLLGADYSSVVYLEITARAGCPVVIAPNPYIEPPRELRAGDVMGTVAEAFGYPVENCSWFTIRAGCDSLVDIEARFFLPVEKMTADHWEVFSEQA